MALSQIIIQFFFSNLPLGKLSISMELFHALSQFNFISKGGMLVSRHINDFPLFCKSIEIDDEDVMCILFTPTLEGHVDRCVIPYHMIPFTLFINLLRIFTNILIGMIIEMFTKQSIKLEWSLTNQLRVFLIDSFIYVIHFLKKIWIKFI